MFIGHNIKHEAIQKALDQCLLTDEEMEMGREKWEECWQNEAVDKIQLSLEETDDEDEEDDEDDEDGDEGEDDSKKPEEDTEGTPTKRLKRYSVACL